MGGGPNSGSSSKDPATTPRVKKPAAANQPKNKSPASTSHPVELPSKTLSGNQPSVAGQASNNLVTLRPGLPTITVSRTLLGPSSNSNHVVTGGSTLSPQALSSHTKNTFPAIVLGTQTFTANSVSEYIVHEQTLAPGSSSIVISASALHSLTAVASPPSPSSSPSLITIGGQIVTPNPTAFPIAGTTISAGGPGVTISGTLVTLAPSGKLGVGNSTIVLGSGNGTLEASPSAFTGDASGGVAWRRSWYLALCLVLIVLLCCDVC